jgi:hypothetical protein
MELVIFVIATLTGAQVSEIMHELDRRDPLDRLEAELVCDTGPCLDVKMNDWPLCIAM